MNTKKLAICGFFTSLICVCSVIRVPLPFTPIPVTLQTFAVSFAGIHLGKKYGLLSVTAYILLGAVGIPVFSGMNSGLGYLGGATGGFIFGFAAGVFIIGLIYEVLNNRIKNANKTFAAAFAIIAGNAVVYLCGAVWYMNFAQVSLAKSFILTVLPFIPADLFKMFLAFTISRILVAVKLENA